MKRKAHAMVLLAALGGGCVTTDKVDPSTQPHQGVQGTMKAAPGVVGPWGEPVAARAGKRPTKAESGLIQAGYKGDAPGGVQQVNFNHVPATSPIPGAVAAVGALVNGPQGMFGQGRTSVRFAGPAGMKVAWYNGYPGQGGFSGTMVEAPGRYNFPQGAVYRLKLSDFPNRPGVELYPTLEVIPAGMKTATFLAHSAVPIAITEEDLEQVAAGNFVVKVIYLPDPAYQDLAAAGPDEVVSTRLEPGVDPVAEATRRGSVLAIVRLGNIDLEAPNTPAMEAPPGSSGGGIPRGAVPAGPGGPPGIMIPNAGTKAPGKITASAEVGLARIK